MLRQTLPGGSAAKERCPLTTLVVLGLPAQNPQKTPATDQCCSFYFMLLPLFVVTVCFHFKQSVVQILLFYFSCIQQVQCHIILYM